MTCEVVVMNKRGAALAADSAITVGDGDKIYHHAQKLFPLAPATSVGIMLSGSPEIMGVPWEIIIKSYARQLGDRRFDRLEEYARDFLRFVEGSTMLFPDSVQKNWFRILVESYWRGQFMVPLRSGEKRQEKALPRTLWPALKQLLLKDHANWRKYSWMPAQGEDSSNVEGGKILSDYGALLDKLEWEFFGTHAPSREIRNALRTTVKLMYDKRWFHPHDRSWIAFVGIGEAEPFPVLLEYQVGSIVAGRLRWAKTDQAEVNRANSAIVVPLAQRDAIDMFFRGIDPGLDAKLDDMLARSLYHGFAKKDRRYHRGKVEKIQKEFRRLLEQDIDERYKAPLIASVDALPQQGLARIAEALVRLTAFRARISIGQKETVDGETNVAVVSKGEGFIWSKRAARE